MAHVNMTFSQQAIDNALNASECPDVFDILYTDAGYTNPYVRDSELESKLSEETYNHVKSQLTMHTFDTICGGDVILFVGGMVAACLDGTDCIIRREDGTFQKVAIEPLCVMSALEIGHFDL